MTRYTITIRTIRHAFLTVVDSPSEQWARVVAVHRFCISRHGRKAIEGIEVAS